jgi:hypothetical protein
VHSQDSKNLNVSFRLITKYLNKQKVCGIIGLNKNMSKFTLLNNQRQLILAFSNLIQVENSNCILNALYTINALNGTPSINNFITEEAENFFFLFTPNKNNLKELPILADSYLDSNDLFLLNITSLTTVTSDSYSFLESIDDTYMPLRPSIEASNGPAQILTWLETYIDQAGVFPYEKNLTFNLAINRIGMYSLVEAAYELILIEPAKGFENASNPSNGLPSIASLSLILNSSDTNKSLQINLRNYQKIDSKFYGDLIIFGSLCFLSENNNRKTHCSKADEQIYVEPSGLFRFTANNNASYTNVILDEISKFGLTSAYSTHDLVVPNNQSDLKLSPSVERHFGSKKSAKLIYAISATNSHLDLFFPEHDSTKENFVEMNATIYLATLSVRMNAIEVLFKRIFYVILTNVKIHEKITESGNETTRYDSNRIYKQENLYKINVMPSETYSNVITFSQSSLLVPILANIREQNVTITIFRIGTLSAETSSAAAAANSSAECTVKSGGYGEWLPDHITASWSLDFSATRLARPNLDYKPIETSVSFSQEQTAFNLTFSLYGSSLSGVNDEATIGDSGAVTKVFYLYLSSPRNGARLIEPSSTYNYYSPFLRVEIRKLQPNYDKLTLQHIRVGFNVTRRALNLNNLIPTLNFFYRHPLRLANTSVVNSLLVNEIYQLKWRAELVGHNSSSGAFESFADKSDLTIRDLFKCGFYSTSGSVVYCEEIVNCYTKSEYCDMLIIFKRNLKLYKDYLIRIKLSPVHTYEFKTNYLNVSVDRDTALLLLKANSNYSTSVRFDPSSLFTVNNKLKLHAYLTIRRLLNLNQTTIVFFRTRELTDSSWVYVNGLKVYTADSGFDFKETNANVTFEPGVAEQTIQISLRSIAIMDSHAGPGLSPLVSTYKNESSPNLYPRMFQVVLTYCAPNCLILAEAAVANVTIITESISLWKAYKQSLNSSDSKVELGELESLTSESEFLLSSLEVDLLSKTLENIISKMSISNTTITSSANEDQKSSEDYKRTLLNTLCNLISLKRIESDSKLKFIHLLESFLYVNMTNLACLHEPTIYMHMNFTKAPCTRLLLNYECARLDASSIDRLWYNGAQFRVELPLNDSTANIRIADQAQRPGSKCLDICFIEMTPSSSKQSLLKESTLYGRVLIVSSRYKLVADNSSIYKNNLSSASSSEWSSWLDFSKSSMLVRMLIPRRIQTDKLCSLYDERTLDWDTSLCKTNSMHSNYVECQCAHNSIYGLASSKIVSSTYFGYDYGWFYTCISIKLFGSLAAILTYFFIYKKYTFASISLMNLIASNALTQLLYLLVVAISPSINVIEPYGNNCSCIILSLLFHYFILTQFILIFAIFFSFYMKIANIFAKSYLKNLNLILAAWLLPILIISLFYLIAGILYEYAANYSAAYIYSDIFDNKQICFIKSVISFLLGLILPSLIFLAIALALLVELYRSISKWRNTSSIYLSRIDATEMKWLLGLVSLILAVNVFMFIHIRIAQVWSFVLFCLFDIALGLYNFFVYAVGRHIKIMFNSNQIAAFPYISSTNDNHNPKPARIIVENYDIQAHDPGNQLSSKYMEANEDIKSKLK